jgi:hypothetical protein
MADTWFVNPHATLDTIRRQMAIYRTELKAVGKGPPRELPIVKEVYCAKDRATALEMAGPYLLAKYRDYARWGQDKVMPDNTDFTRPLHELMEGRFILGSPEDCYEGLKPYWTEFGVNHSSFARTGSGCRSRPRLRACASSRTSSCPRSAERHHAPPSEGRTSDELNIRGW